MCQSWPVVISFMSVNGCCKNLQKIISVFLSHSGSKETSKVTDKQIDSQTLTQTLCISSMQVKKSLKTINTMESRKACNFLSLVKVSVLTHFDLVLGRLQVCHIHLVVDPVQVLSLDTDCKREINQICCCYLLGNCNYH